MKNLSIEELKRTAEFMRGYGHAEAAQAIDELIALRELKGDQVPYGYIVRHIYEPDGMGTMIRANEQDYYQVRGDYHYTELFTAPQNPVVCPPDGIAKALHDCDWAGVSIGNKAIILAAIRALRAQPQKPVVSKQKLCNWLEEEFGVTESQYDSYASSFAESVGGIVKDGE